MYKEMDVKAIDMISFVTQERKNSIILNCVKKMM